jgi:hypothetical protein
LTGGRLPRQPKGLGLHPQKTAIPASNKRILDALMKPTGNETEIANAPMDTRRRVLNDRISKKCSTFRQQVVG